MKGKLTWSKDISTDYHLISIPTYPDGALVDVEFKCSKCGQKLLAENVEIPFPGFGETEEESRVWGDRVTVECECGETYDVSADNSIAGWMIEIEDGKPPANFRYKIRQIYGESEDDEV